MKRVPEPHENLDNYFPSTSLSFESAVKNGRYLLKPNEAKALELVVIPLRLTSDGYYVTELEFIDPRNSNQDIEIDNGSQGMNLHATMTNMESGEETGLQQFAMGITYYIEAEALNGWKVHDKTFTWQERKCGK